jgi:N6-L-threonylcarbamoyladenine synthase
MVQALMEQGMPEEIQAIGASTRPREVEGSYMPCFLAGESQGSTMAQIMKVPFYPCSHQQGHVAAAAWSAGCMDLLDRPHLAWHLSGGTTELLYVEPDGVLVRAKQIGGSSDISAGQLIDRTGKRLGLPFPAGKAVDALSLDARKNLYFSVKVQGTQFSLSGIENKMNALAEQGESPAEICRFVLGSIIYAVDKASRNALTEYPFLPVLCAGGVASNRLLRDTMTQSHNALFAEPAYSTDNAMGVAILAYRMLAKERNHG